MRVLVSRIINIIVWQGYFVVRTVSVERTVCVFHPFLAIIVISLGKSEVQLTVLCPTQSKTYGVCGDAWKCHCVNSVQCTDSCVNSCWESVMWVDVQIECQSWFTPVSYKGYRKVICGIILCACETSWLDQAHQCTQHCSDPLSTSDWFWLHPSTPEG